MFEGAVMKIIHVEDDVPLKDILRACLIAHEPRLEIMQFTTGDEALRHLQNNPEEISLFILDIRLPGSMTGVELARKIREMNIQSNIVITSAFSRPGLEVLTDLKCEYYRKPWHLKELSHKVMGYVISKAPSSLSTTLESNPVSNPLLK
jgi:DNA-binding response OmpR family regulator